MEELSLDGDSLTEVLSDIARNPGLHLKTLSFTEQFVIGNMMDSLCQILHKSASLVKLDLSGALRLPVDALNAIAAAINSNPNIHLESLDLSRSIFDRDFSALANLLTTGKIKNLSVARSESMNIGDGIGGDFYSALEKSNLESLGLSSLGDKLNIARLSSALKHNKFIKSLDLSGNSLTEDDMKALIILVGSKDSNVSSVKICPTSSGMSQESLEMIRNYAHLLNFVLEWKKTVADEEEKVMPEATAKKILFNLIDCTDWQQAAVVKFALTELAREDDLPFSVSASLTSQRIEKTFPWSSTKCKVTHRVDLFTHYKDNSAMSKWLKSHLDQAHLPEWIHFVDGKFTFDHEITCVNLAGAAVDGNTDD